jgi:alpha-L-fucosidase
VDRLAAVGRWVRVHGEAIYGTTASPFAAPFAWGRVTRKAGTLYVHVFDWPASGTLTLPAFQGTITGARLLGAPAGAQVRYATSASGTTLTLPATPPDPIASVIALDLTADLAR